MGKIKPKVENLTVICVAGNRQAESIASLYKAMSEIDAEDWLLLTNIDISASGIRCINVGGLDTWEKYNHFIIKNLYQYFGTKYCLLVQWDGILDNGQLWSDDFLKFDYIGAAWLNGECGNGGFSIRSRKLMKIVAQDDFIEITAPEDNCLCILYKKYLQHKYGITYADKETCDRFSFELNQPLQETFGHHSFHWDKYKPTVLIKRMYALGDLLQTEPIMHYYHKKGYNVALETNPEFYGYFRYHYFPITFKENLNPDLPIIEIDLNKAYEVFPQKLHLDSYYDFAQIPKEERVYRNPMLALNFNYKHPQFKIFKKYVVFHIDERQEPHRNIYGISWHRIASFFISMGYDCVQVGMGKHQKIHGVLQMNTPTPDMLMWVVASSDMFVGIDSGVSHIASGFDIPSVILSGSVDLRLIHADLSNKLWIHNHDKKVCNQPYCWHNAGVTETGQDCYVDKANPPCVQFDTDEVLGRIEKYLKKQI